MSHERVVVSPLAEVVVILPFNVVEVSDGSSDHIGILVSLLVGADGVFGAREEGHGDRVDLGHIDKVGLFDTRPLCLELLEAVDESTHDKVLLIHHRNSLAATLFRVSFANDDTESVTDVLKVSFPVWTVDRVDSILLEMCNS